MQFKIQTRLQKQKIQTANKLDDIIEQGNNELIRVVIKEYAKKTMNDKFYYHQLEYIDNSKIEGINALSQINGNKEIKFLPSTKSSIL